MAVPSVSPAALYFRHKPRVRKRRSRSILRSTIASSSSSFRRRTSCRRSPQSQEPRRRGQSEFVRARSARFPAPSAAAGRSGCPWHRWPRRRRPGLPAISQSTAVAASPYTSSSPGSASAVTRSGYTLRGLLYHEAWPLPRPAATVGRCQQPVFAGFAVAADEFAAPAADDSRGRRRAEGAAASNAASTPFRMLPQPGPVPY